MKKNLLFITISLFCCISFCCCSSNNRSYSYTQNSSDCQTIQRTETVPSYEIIAELDDSSRIMLTGKGFRTIMLGKYGSIMVPGYLFPADSHTKSNIATKTNKYIEDNFSESVYYEIGNLLEHSDKKRYATFSSNFTSADGYQILTEDDMQYDSEMDEYLKEALTDGVRQSGWSIIKWYPYDYPLVCGHRVMRLHYVRSGQATPVEVFIYSFDVSDGVVTLTFSCRQDEFLDNTLEDFSKSLSTIRIK